MENNITDIAANISKILNNVDTNIGKFNASYGCVDDLLETYISKEIHEIKLGRIYKAILAGIILISNLIVVISSGLILKTGQQPKSTYILLGNVSFADMFIGVALLIRIASRNLRTSDPLCFFEMALLVCHTKVSIFSVGLIAVDRYIYIMHGLYYQRWFNTRRVKVAVLCIWTIGIATGLMPLTGWVNKELVSTRCVYYALFPGPLVVFNSIVSLTPIVTVAILYAMILKRVIKNFAHIKAREKPFTETDINEPPMLRMNRGKVNPSDCALVFEKCKQYKAVSNLKRCSSFNTNACIGFSYKRQESNLFKTSSYGDLSTINNKALDNQTPQLNKSEFSVYTIESMPPNINSGVTTAADLINVCSNLPKKRNSNKMRAIAIVTLTSCSIIFTWTPYFLTLLLFVFCEHKQCNPRCMHLKSLLRTMTGWAFCNSILNPLIYAWWHKGFQNSIKAYYRKHLRKYIRKNSN